MQSDSPSILTSFLFFDSVFIRVLNFVFFKLNYILIPLRLLCYLLIMTIKSIF